MLFCLPPSVPTIEQVIAGTGALAAAGSKVAVHYNDWLADCAKFGSSVELRGVG
jgi:FKBP-type peptidyl-prolyl cis-trans isomerase